MSGSSRWVPVTLIARIVPTGAGATGGASVGAPAGGAACCAFAGTAVSPAIIVVANRAVTTGRCLLLLIIAVTRITSNSIKLFPPTQTTPNRASLPHARQPIKPDRLFQSPKDDKSLKVTSTIMVSSAAKPDL